VPEREVDPRADGTLRLRHAVRPARNRVATDQQHAAGLEIDRRTPFTVAHLEPPRRAEARRCDVGLTAVRVIAVTVPADRIAPVAIEVREHGVEAALRQLFDPFTNPVETRRERTRRVHHPRVAVADGPVHRDEPWHRHRAAVDLEALLLPLELR